MKALLKSSLLATFAVAATCLLPNPAQAGQEKLQAKIAETSQEVGRSRDQLQTTMDVLSALTSQKGGDLKPAFEKFQAEVAKTKKVAEATRATSTDMQKQSASYFGEWEKEIAGVSNAKLRKKAEKRMAAVKENYTDAIKSLDSAAGQFGPFLSDLADIEKILTNDLTAGGIKSIKGTVSSARFHMTGGRRSIQTAMDNLNKMAARLKSDA
jgi:Protein of unknown function (DUF2959)